MKVRNIFVLLLLFFGLVGLNNLLDGQDADDFGKLSLWIVDPVSGNQVNEVFIITLFNCDETPPSRYLKQRKTNNKGYLALDLNPGQYCLHIYPESLDSKYCIEPYHFKNDQFYFPVMIEKGKVTHFRKKATFGGAIKIRLLDTNGRIIDPLAELPSGAVVALSMTNPNYILGQPEVYDMKVGEKIIHTLFPSKYFLRIDFRGTGYERLTFREVPVIEKEITEIDCVIDLDDITGIEGKIVDINGNPVKGIEIFLVPNFDAWGDFNDATDKNGYYCITGLPEGPYYIGLSSNEYGISINKKETIEIKKGTLTQKNITIE